MHQFAVKRSAQPQHWLSNIDAVTIRPASIGLSKKKLRAEQQVATFAQPLQCDLRPENGKKLRHACTKHSKPLKFHFHARVIGPMIQEWCETVSQPSRSRHSHPSSEAFFIMKNKVFAWYRKSKMNIDEHVSPSWRCEWNSRANCLANSNLQIWTWNFCAFVRDILQKYTTLQFSILLFSTLICSSLLFFVFFCTFFCAALLVSALLLFSILLFSCLA